ncbi:hypothetical protein K7432_009416 [Basidiobolus ranarum]|uniref:Acyl-coenzyme A oxidase n=1 Tax=Basidiobolus ranarum TaxID=34480 RepID=A0ABR2VXV1_9FUNG
MTTPFGLKPSEPHTSSFLIKEREQSSLNSKQLSLYIHGEEFLERQERLLNIIENDPVFSKTIRCYQGRSQRILNAMRKDKRILELKRQYRWTDDDLDMADLIVDESRPFSLHRSMFLPTLKNQTTPEQQELFLKPALDYRIIGCYAQTELGHGSNIQGLETTATYIPETKEFEIHSPSLTASKWWIGGLGIASTHAVVMARLITNGKDLGPHPFVVPIRSLQDHRPLAGIKVGDVGPKFGFNTVDNGFILFDHVRIPHNHMLARYAKVDPKTGSYTKPVNDKLSYGTMVYVRVKIVHQIGLSLARATTIATRYSAMRRQFATPQSMKAEVPVLNYEMVQYRIIPLIAQTFALLFTGKQMKKQYLEFMAELKQGDFSKLKELHASSSGLKSLSTTMAISGIEVCRRACGGHGFSQFSGLAEFYGNVLPNATWEGDNFILTQQTGKYLQKFFRDLSSRAAAGPVQGKATTEKYLLEYLTTSAHISPIKSMDDMYNHQYLLKALAHRAARLIHSSLSGSSQIDHYRISEAHCQYLILHNFVHSLPEPNDALYPSLARLCSLYAAHTLESHLADFLEDEYFAPRHAPMVRAAVRELIQELRPDVVPLVDAFNIPDFVVSSALGESDGVVYEKMMEKALLEPLNQTEVVAGYEECIRPFVHGGMGSELNVRL